MSTFDLHIATPEDDFYSGEVEYMSFDAPDGRVGLMRGALARIIALKAGRIDIKAPSVDESFYCGDGIVRVDNSGVIVLTSRCGKQDVDESGTASDINGQARNDLDGHELKYVKAKIAASMLKMKEKNKPDEKKQ